MREDLIRDLFEKEEYYWWPVSKREMVWSLLRQFGCRKNRETCGLAVDIGCGGGFNAKVFESDWRVVGADVSTEALRLCKRRGLRRLCKVDMTGFSLPFKTGSFDLVLALDVIEHVEDDLHALAECNRILKDEGLLVVTVPAFMTLWSPWDEALGHHRRYTAGALSRTARQASLSIARISYGFLFVFPAAILVRFVKRLFQKEADGYSTDFMPLPGIINGLLILMGRVEQFLVARLHCNLPFGLSVFSIMTKKPFK